MRRAERLRVGASCGRFAEVEGSADEWGVLEDRNLLVIRLNIFEPGGACVCVRDGGMGALWKGGMSIVWAGGMLYGMGPRAAGAKCIRNARERVVRVWEGAIERARMQRYPRARPQRVEWSDVRL